MTAAPGTFGTEVEDSGKPWHRGPMVDRGANALSLPKDWPAHPDPILALNRMGSFDWDLDTGLFHLDAQAHDILDLCPDEYDGRPETLQRAMFYEQEKDLAQGLQQAMLPRSIPSVPGADIAVRYRSAALGRDIGGDWYDLIPLPGGRGGAVIGDVQGHDTHAAAVMGQLRMSCAPTPPRVTRLPP
ncbi:hypothetical protein GCM10022206_62660 [Streptomyces chiangmaiensis]